MGTKAVTDIDHYGSIANSVRYSKDVTDIETYTPSELETEVQNLAVNYRSAAHELGEAQTELSQNDEYFDEISNAIVYKDGGEPPAKSEMPTRIAAIPTQDNALLNSLINRSITSIENSEVTSIGANAFQNCTNLTSVSLPNVTSIGVSTFQNCTNLTSVSLPNVTSIGASAFYSCTNLTSVSFPNVTSIGANAFYNCNLTSVSFPNVTSIGVNTFYSCNLTSVSLPNVTSIGAIAFQNCTNLSIVILGKRAMLSKSNAFSGTDNAITYVQPEDLSWYSTATNWSALYTAGRVKSIEELPT